MIDTRTAAHVSPHEIENLRIVDSPFDGMLRVVADYRNPRMIPSSVILWEPSLLRLPTENVAAEAVRQYDRLRREMTS